MMKFLMTSNLAQIYTNYGISLALGLEDMWKRNGRWGNACGLFGISGVERRWCE